MKIYQVEMPDGSVINVELPEGRREDAILVAYEKYNQNKNKDFVDRAYFEEDVGVRAPSIRAELGLTDNYKEKENVLRSYVGSKGFTRDSRGRLAITPTGQDRLVARGLLREEDKSEKSIIIDEKGTTFADIADFSGIVGPVAGALFALTPGGRVLRFLNRFSGDRFARTAAAAIGSGAGEAGEEAVEAALGTSQESFGDIALNVAGEAGLGATGQFVGEAVGAGYKALLGMNAPAETIKLARKPLEGIVDPAKVRALERIRGRKLTPREIREEATVYGAPQQKAFGSEFRSRVQAAGETLTGKQKRMLPLIEAEMAEGRQLLDKLGAYSLSFDDLVSKADAGALTKAQFEIKLKDLRQNRINAIERINELTKKSAKSINAGALSGVPGTGQAGEFVQQNLAQSYKSFMNAAENQYFQVQSSIFKPKTLTRDANVIQEQLRRGEKFVNSDGQDILKAYLRKERKDTFDELTATSKNAAIREVQEAFDAVLADQTIKDIVFREGTTLRLFLQKNPHISERLGIRPNEIDQVLDNISDKALMDINDVFLRDVIGSSAPQVSRFVNLVGEEAQVINFKPIKDRLDNFINNNQILKKSLNAGEDLKDIKALTEMDDFINFTQLMKFKAETSALARANNSLPSTLTKELGVLGEKADDMLTDLARGGEIATRLFKEGVSEADKAKILASTRLLKDANRFYKTGMDAFEVPLVTKLLSDYKRTGGLDIDQVFELIVKKDRPELLKSFLQGFRKTSDDLVESVVDPEQGLIIKQRLGGELLKKEIQAASNFDGTIDATKLARRLDSYGSTLDELFDNPKQVRSFIKDLGQITYKIDEDALMKLSDNPSDLMKGYRGYLDAQEEVFNLKKSQLFRDITNASDEDVVDVLLTPRNASQIKEVFDVVGPEGSEALKTEAMRSIIRKMIKNSDANDIRDVFNPDVFRTTLDSIGDESLTAFFGRDVTKALREYQARLGVLVAAEGGGAGTLIAGAVAINALNLAFLPVVIQLGVMQSIFKNPTIVRALTKTDRPALNMIMSFIGNYLRQVAPRQIGVELSDIGSQAVAQTQAEIEDIQARPEVQDAIFDLKSQTQDVAPSFNIDLPDISAVNLSRPNQLSNDPALRAAILSGQSDIV
jgi:hypothetical protein